MRVGWAVAAASLTALGCRAQPSSPSADAASKDSAVGGLVPLELRPSDVARRLSRFLWESEPDADLLQALETTPPANRADVGRRATMMLGDSRARVMVASFFRQWLQLDNLGTATKNLTLYPEFTAELRADMIAEATRLTTFVTFDGDGRFPTLFTTNFSFVNDRLAPLYGVASAPGQDFVLTTLDATQRSGVLTFAGVLANQPDTGEPPVSRRGIFVNSLLCRPLPPPHPGTEMQPPPDKATRDWVLQISSTPSCGACHALFDPIGLALGQYDALGRFQTTERGFAIDASTSWTPPGAPTVAFKGARELATLLADLTDVRDCFVKQWLKFATNVDLPDGDPSVIQARGAFVAANLDIRALIVAVTMTDEFLAPQGPGGGD